jgi:hypothetical protein
MNCNYSKTEHKRKYIEPERDILNREVKENIS